MFKFGKKKKDINVEDVIRKAEISVKKSTELSNQIASLTSNYVNFTNQLITTNR